MTGAGSGICAKFIERGGVDILGVYNTGYFRMHGYGSLAGMLPIADANELVYQTARREVLPQVRATPVIAGVNGVDPLRDMRLFLEDLRRIGISGVQLGSAIGRIAMERPLEERAAAFKAVRFPARRSV